MEAQVLPRTGRLFLPRSRKVLAAFSDERLVEQVRRGNDDAFEAIYDRHHRAILSFCRHMLASPDEAEDAVQQTFISAFGAMRADARDIRLKPWLFTIARNRCLSILRARREQPAELDDVPTAGLADEVQHRSDLRELLEDLRRLPVDQRAALVLSEVGDLSHAEVGAVVGCEVAKVKSLVFQARSSLIETRRARDVPCSEIREQLATATGGALRRGPLRRHLRACQGCAEFRDDVMRQRRALAALLPVVPTLGLKKCALAAIGTGGGGAGGTAAGVGGGGIASLASSGAAVKVAAAVVTAGVAVGGGLVLGHGAPAPAAEAAGGQPGGGQAWPAPPAGTGPGPRVHLVARRAVAHRRAHAHAQAKRRAQARHARRTTRTAARRAHAQAPTGRSGAVQPRSPHHTHSPGTHSAPAPVAPQPAPTAPAPAQPAPAAPQPATGNEQHHDNGNHNGWGHSSHGGQGNGHAGDEHGGGSPGGDHHGGGGDHHHGDGGGD
ncbi:MAG TPA: RNA polymerase sigma factor [Thermoleophilaceae bacterium]